jgi:hypothetical protein
LKRWRRFDEEDDGYEWTATTWRAIDAVTHIPLDPAATVYDPAQRRAVEYRNTWRIPWALSAWALFGHLPVMELETLEAEDDEDGS